MALSSAEIKATRVVGETAPVECGGRHPGRPPRSVSAAGPPVDPLAQETQIARSAVDFAAHWLLRDAAVAWWGGCLRAWAIKNPPQKRRAVKLLKGALYARVTLPALRHLVHTLALRTRPLASLMVIFCTLGRNQRLVTR